MLTKCCKTCDYFEARTSFCRCEPPVPTSITIEDRTDNNKKKDIVVSKFPVPAYPDADWCGKYIPKLI